MGEPRDIFVMEINQDGEDQVMHINQTEFTQEILEQINVFSRTYNNGVS